MRLALGGCPLTRAGEGPAGAAPEVVIEGIAGGGAGVGRLPDGRAVFVHRTAPGDVVRVHVTRDGARWARGEATERLRDGPGRRPAPCPHYDRCGGCTLEHLRYDEQLRWKGRIVSDALQRIGELAVDPPLVEPSPTEFRYRSRVTFHLRRLPGGRVVAGFHELGRPDRVVDMGEECLLPEEGLARVWGALRREWGPGARRLPGGRSLRLGLRSTSRGVLLVIHGARGPGSPRQLLEAVEGLAAVWSAPADGEELRLLAGDPDPVGPTAFVQVNREAARILQEAVLREVGPPSALRVVDAYCGVGVYGRHLAREGARAVGIELNRDAAAAARAQAPEGLAIVQGRVEERLQDHLPADVVILNPPRAGLHEHVPALLAARPPSRVVYVSCDPSTLARDASRLREAFALEGLRSFDLFPQTAHVETVATFAARRGGG